MSRAQQQWFNELDQPDDDYSDDYDYDAEPADDAAAIELDEPDAAPSVPDTDAQEVVIHSLSPISTTPATAPSAAATTSPEPCQSSPTEATNSKAIVIGSAVATVALSAVLSGVLLALRTHPHVAEMSNGPTAVVRTVTASPSASAEPNQDSPIHYQATAHGCLPGSTGAQSAAGGDHQAWVCVTGGNIGQYVTFDLGRTMLITAACLTSGWVGSDASGVDQWLLHRVVSRVQWSFNDVPATVVFQDTNNTHGEVCQPIPGRGVLASQVTMLVQETSRAPADVVPSSAAASDDGIFGPATVSPSTSPSTVDLGSLPGSKPSNDPTDNTFAVSTLKLLGHQPN
jgi:hypothetical protein